MCEVLSPPTTGTSINFKFLKDGYINILEKTFSASSTNMMELKGECYGNGRVYDNEEINVNCDITLASDSITLTKNHFYAIKFYKSKKGNR